MSFVLLLVIVCIVADLAVRYLIHVIQKKRFAKERMEALDEGLKLDVSHESPSLKRVEVKNPSARILCVDDEDIILASFRRILVLDGYSIDTVETGQEALGLLQKHHYDFVFTDLRMPAMDGVEVVKGVKHMRPDIDVVIITGYATVETAVTCMKYGAMDYVQKPFTEEELRSFVAKALIKRKDRLEKQLKPQVHVTHIGEANNFPAGEFSIPGGVFISAGHCWVGLTPDGTARIGMDDFAKKLLGPVDHVNLPNVGMAVRAGQPLFSIKLRQRTIQFRSPISGRVLSVNPAINSMLDGLEFSPYHSNWFCTIDGEELDQELPGLKIGKSAVSYFQEELDRARSFMKEHGDPKGSEDPTGHGLCIGAFAQLEDSALGQATTEFFGR